MMNKNSFAVTPPRGWNSYDYYDTTVTEADIRANALAMADKLKDFGYEYVVVDIQWYAKNPGSMRDKFQYIPFGHCAMDGFGRLLPDEQRFPSAANGQGFKPLADFVHSLGLKFGIHIMRGIPRAAAHEHLPVKGCGLTADMLADPASICDWNPDMYGLRNLPESQAYYDSIIELYTSWGVDFIKCDDICNTHAYKDRPYMGEHEIEMLAKAIEKCGRAIVLSLSPGPALIEKATHYCQYANMWRISDDFWDSWPLLLKMFDYCQTWQYVVSGGCWPDCDMLPVGKIGRGFGDERNTRFTKAEQKTMMALWCLFRSPLMIGGELTRLDPWTQELLCCRPLLELESGDYRPRQVKKDKTQAIWLTDSKEKQSVVVALFNLGDEETYIEATYEQLGAVSRIPVGGANFGVIGAAVEPHGVAVFELLPNGSTARLL